MAEPKTTVLYDEDCGFCKWSLSKILRWDRRNELLSVAIQSEEGQRLLESVPEDRRLDSWHLVEPSGTVRSAGDAAAPLFDVLPAGKPLAAAARTFPGATERAYRAVANNRSRLGQLIRS